MNRQAKAPFNTTGGRHIVRTGLVLGMSLIGGLVVGVTVAAGADEGQQPRLSKESLRQFAEVLNAVKATYVEPVDDKTLLDGAIKGLLEGLDGDSSYLDKRSLGDLQYGAVAGIGLEIGIVNGSINVVSAIEDTPASRSGIKKGDVISQIDAIDVKGMALTQVVDRLRGKQGSLVTLSILRQGERQPLSLTLQREIIKVKSVRSKWLEPGYAYVRLTQFQDDTVAALGRQLRELYQQHAVDGLVLDVRNNSGGLFPSAVGVCAAFLPDNALVVSTDGRLDDARRTYHATPADYRSRSSRTDGLENLPESIKTIPLVVLVNGKSAAASEIVAAALQDYQRAVVVGTSTFGRASIQTVYPMPNGSAIKLTTSRWYTPKGKMVQNKGVIPDITLADGSLEFQQGVLGEDSVLSKALGILKKLPRQ